MQRLKYSVFLLTIALLVFPSTTSSLLRGQVTTSQTAQQQRPRTPGGKFLKGKKNPIPNRYIVILQDDVVSDSAPLEVRRARITAIAHKHARMYVGTYDYIYETALKGYAIELPNEAAAIALSELPEVKWVEEDSAGSFPASNSYPERPACSGTRVAALSLERPFGLKMYGRRISYLSGGISRRARLVIRTRDQFTELWNEITSSTSDKPPLPEVDFSREMLAVAATGPEKEPHSLIIDSACEVNNQLEVVVRDTKSVPCGASIGLLPQPVDIVRLPKTDLPVVFREIEDTFDCKQLYFVPPAKKPA
ncbi:MAG TPA: hypothetical protein VFR51_13530 [Pyrinomonadaceae bacterium]|nr:hypothetical protein [Pyrinomonadaceae bacterium]